MRLYHFTAPEYLPMIKENGIVRGNVYTSPSEAFQAVWLTADPSWTTQDWTQASTHDKARFRITVDIPDSSRKLWPWPKLAKQLGVSPEWYEIQINLRGDPEQWYVFLGVVPPEWFETIEERPADVTVERPEPETGDED
jgi:hypothetical protein